MSEHHLSESLLTHFVHAYKLEQDEQNTKYPLDEPSQDLYSYVMKTNEKYRVIYVSSYFLQSNSLQEIKTFLAKNRFKDFVNVDIENLMIRISSKGIDSEVI